MRRRGVLGSIAGGLTLTVAGCVAEAAPSGPRNPPSAEDARSGDPTDDGGRDSGIHVQNFDFFEGEDGRLVVEIVVANDAPNQRSGTIIAVASTPDTTVEGSESVTLDPDEQRELSIALEMEYDTFAANGNLSLDIEQ